MIVNKEDVFTRLTTNVHTCLGSTHRVMYGLLNVRTDLRVGSLSLRRSFTTSCISSTTLVIGNTWRTLRKCDIPKPKNGIENSNIAWRGCCWLYQTCWPEDWANYKEMQLSFLWTENWRWLWWSRWLQSRTQLWRENLGHLRNRCKTGHLYELFKQKLSWQCQSVNLKHICDQ